MSLATILTKAAGAPEPVRCPPNAFICKAVESSLDELGDMYGELSAGSPERYLIISMMLCASYYEIALTKKHADLIARVMKDAGESAGHRIAACLVRVRMLIIGDTRRRCGSVIKKAMKMAPLFDSEKSNSVYCILRRAWPVCAEHIYVKDEALEVAENLASLRKIEDDLDNRHLARTVSDHLRDTPPDAWKKFGLPKDAVRLVSRIYRQDEPATRALVEKFTAMAANHNRVGGVNCDACRRPRSVTPLMRCGKCDKAWYCSRECQKAAWSAHKVVCRTPGHFEPGDHVMLKDLVSTTKYNYQPGRVIKMTKNGRWKVRMLFVDKCLSVKAENMDIVNDLVCQDTSFD